MVSDNMLDVRIEGGSTAATAPSPAPRSVPTADPAILSFGRPPPSAQAPYVSPISVQPAALQDISQPLISPVRSVNKLPPMAKLQRKELSGELNLDIRRGGQVAAPATIFPSATLTEPFNDLSLNGHGPGKTKKEQQTEFGENGDQGGDRAGDQENIGATHRKGKTKRGRRKNAASREFGPAVPLQAATMMQNGENMETQSTPKMTMGPGWRETPLTETRETSPARRSRLHARKDTTPSMPNMLFPESSGSKMKKRSRKQEQADYDKNGWATGDATDIQEMGDFDFEANHQKFDKKKVFEQIRQEDTTADEARLVNFNRLPARPGTYGGKNLHFTENVLDSPANDFVDHSSESDMAVNEAKISSGRSSRRASSRATTRKAPSRKGSAFAGADGQIIKSGALPEIKEDRLSVASPKPSVRSRQSSSQQRSYLLRTAGSQKPLSQRHSSSDA